LRRGLSRRVRGGARPTCIPTSSSGSGLLLLQLLQLLPSSSCSGGLLLLLVVVVLLPSTTSSSYGQSTCGNQFISWFSKTSVHQFDRHRQTDQRGKQEYSSSSS
jgi:hypothetical protein